MAKTNERVDPKEFRQEVSNPDQLLQALKPRLNQSAAVRVVIILICSDHQVCSV